MAINILVCEDNQIIRKSIIKRITNNVHNISNIYEAVDGLDGYNKIIELKPDIVITDIEMPNQNAFYMIEGCAKNGLDIKFIIISGYDNFEYMKSSIRYSVVNYLLKPYDTKELIATINSTINLIHKSNISAIDNNRSSLRSDLSDLFNYKINTDYFGKTCNIEGISDKDIILFTVNLVNENEHMENKISEISIIEQKIENIFNGSTCIFGSVYKNVYSGIIVLNDDNFTLNYKNEVYNLIKREIKQEYRSYISFSNSCKILNIITSFENSIKCICTRFSNENRTILDQYQKINIDISTELQYIATKIDSNEHNLISKKITSIVSESLDNCNINNLQFLFNIVLSKCNYDVDYSKSRIEYLILQYGCKDQISNILNNVIKYTLNDSANFDIEKVVSYINSNYKNPINISSISLYFGMNAIYLGQILKKNLGKSFNSYINELRIEYAKKMIDENTDILIKDLALSCGYSDSQYFTKTFKKLENMSPTEYIKIKSIKS